MSTDSLLQITGDRKLIRKLERLASRGSRRVSNQAMRKGLTVVTRGIRSEVPGRLQSVRRTVGSRFQRARGQSQKQAKAGLSVGKKRAAKTPRRSSRGGVGMSARNVHWWALGTTNRRVKKTGRDAGRMPASDAVARGYRKTESTAREAIRKSIRDGLEREAQRP